MLADPYGQIVAGPLFISLPFLPCDLRLYGIEWWVVSHQAFALVGGAFQQDAKSFPEFGRHVFRVRETT